MADLVQWGKIRFYVKKGIIRGLADVQLTAQCVTEDTTTDGEQYASLKSKGPVTATLSGLFDAQIGETPQKSAKQLLKAAADGTNGLLYFNGKKAFKFKLLATQAQITNVRFGPKGEWQHCDFSLTLKQCTKGDGETVSSDPPPTGGGGSRKYKVQIEGMGVVEVTATGIQDACNKAGCQSWTGTVYVNGIAYSLVKGRIQSKEYRVEAEGKAAKTVKAATLQEALTRAGLGKFTGKVTVDGVTYNLQNGKIVKPTGKPASTADSTEPPPGKPTGVLGSPGAPASPTGGFLAGIAAITDKIKPTKKPGKPLTE